MIKRAVTFKAEYLCWNQLKRQEQIDWASAKDSDKDEDWDTYLVVRHNGEIIAIETDLYQPEDKYFYRDFCWISTLINKAYSLGLKDGVKEKEEFIDE